MKQAIKMDATEVRIRELSDKKVVEVLEANPYEIVFDQFQMLQRQAMIGLQAVRDRDLQHRINQGQVIRIISFVAADSDERKKYIELSMPKILPNLKS